MSAKDTTSRPPGGGTGLKGKVHSMGADLDELEILYQQANQAIRGVVSVVSGLLPDDLEPSIRQGLEELKAAAHAQPPDPGAVAVALDALKTIILAEPVKPSTAVEVAGEGGQADSESSEAARHVLLTVLEGLRLGDDSFDTQLDVSIDHLSQSLAEGHIRMAMVTAADLMDQFRQTFEARRRAAEEALMEVASELMVAKADLVENFSIDEEARAKANRDNSDQLGASLTGLAEKLSKAESLDTLKYQALDHIRNMRDYLVSRRAADERFYEQRMGLLAKAKKALIMSRQRIQAMEQESRRLATAAVTDPLTGLLNKRALNHDLADAVSNPEDHPLTLIIFDIDHFKSINDTFGHRAGDKALQTIAAQVQKVLRQGQLLYRYAGDEFVLVLPRTTVAEAMAVAERVRHLGERIRFTFRDKGEMRPTLSLGVAQLKPGEAPAQIFERADQALIQAKRGGRNRVMSAEKA